MISVTLASKLVSWLPLKRDPSALQVNSLEALNCFSFIDG